MKQWSEREMLELAARGLGKVDHLGVRGVTLVSMEEIAAMAGGLARPRERWSSAKPAPEASS